MKKGYFLIEALLAIVIFSMLVLSIFSMISFLQRRTVRSTFESDAALLMQDGMEISHSVLRDNWNINNGVYKPIFNVLENSWALEPGEETNLETRFRRKIEIKDICRDQNTGEKIEFTGVCTGGLDPNSREIITTVSWNEEGNPREVEASLLILKINE